MRKTVILCVFTVLLAPTSGTLAIHRTARLLKTTRIQERAGLDFPFGPIPPLYIFCFSASGEQLLGQSSPIFRSKKQELLAGMVGKDVELEISKSSLQIIDPPLRLKLKRVQSFQPSDCQNQ